ncbi:MAG TPA: S41 family peptidase [Chitinophagaceae bacterium]|nr:S41 family peptidase [Chitinophagaceae bacterium]
MKKKYKLIKLIFSVSIMAFSLTGICQKIIYNPNQLYSVNELQDDFKFLRTNLEKNHPNLHLYTSKEKLGFFLDSLYKCITRPLSEMDFYNLITLINSKLKDGHTMLLPSEEAGNYFNENARFFPFYIKILNNRLYVNMNCSTDTLISEGSEILNINKIPSKDILDYLLTRQIRDGNNQTYPIWIMTNYFKEYFSFSFGHPDKFHITFKSKEYENKTVTIDALSKDSIRFYRKLKYNERDSISSPKQGIIFETNKQSGIALLSIKSFDPDILNSVYHQSFDNTIKEIFDNLNKGNIQNLILDLRDNQGGDFETGKLLLSYLLLRPIKYLPKSNNKEIIIPKPNSYKGNLYVLINGGSFSSTAILCSYLEATKRGFFIGEETGGNKIIISGDPIDTILPNTKILFSVSTTGYVIRKNRNKGRGVIPNYYTNISIDNVITDSDIPKQIALDIILKQLK